MQDAAREVPNSADDVRARIHAVRARIVRACHRAGRDPSEVTLVAVSKTFSAADVAEAAAAGVEDFGENRVQELTQKAIELPGRQEGGPIRWHMIGHLQRNKAKDVVRVADLFHALDSVRLARELDKRCLQAARTLPCLIQVNTSGEGTKDGVPPEAVEALVNEVTLMQGLELRGFMTIAAPVDDPEEVRHEFRVLRQIRNRVQDAHPKLRLEYLSMGMSGDFEVAVEEGATHVRLGRILFGDRT